MATCFATLSNPAQGSALNLPVSAPAYSEFKFVAKAASTLPISAGAFNLQYLLDNFGPGKSRHECLPPSTKTAVIVSERGEPNPQFEVLADKVKGSASYSFLKISIIVSKRSASKDLLLTAFYGFLFIPLPSL